MVIHTDSSIVPDSTLSSSPSPSTSPIVKRAAFTYGRRKDVQTAPDPDSSATLAESSSSSRPRLYSTGQSELEEEVPPSSYTSEILESSSVTLTTADVETSTPFTRKKDENKEMDVDSSGRKSLDSPTRSDDAGPSSFEFSWKAQLKLIDEDFEASDERTVSSAVSGAPNVLSASENGQADASMSLATQPFSSQPPKIDDVFGSLTPNPMEPSSPPPPVAAFGMSYSTSPEPGIVKRPKRRAVVVDSDDDLGDSSINSSTKIPHPINTPKSRSSPTPPTSDLDLSIVKPRSKGKEGKASVTNVPRLLFDKGSEQSLEAPRVKKVLAAGNRKDKESRPKIKVFIISS
jgi:mediator of replication checkpoint protein 1